MPEVFYWKGQTGSARTVNVNTVRTSASIGDRYFISAANNWNNTANWMQDYGPASRWGKAGYRARTQGYFFRKDLKFVK